MTISVRTGVQIHPGQVGMHSYFSADFSLLKVQDHLQPLLPRGWKKNTNDLINGPPDCKQARARN